MKIDVALAGWQCDNAYDDDHDDNDDDHDIHNDDDNDDYADYSNDDLSGRRPCWLAIFPLPTHLPTISLFYLFILKFQKVNVFNSHPTTNAQVLCFVFLS